MNSDIVSTEKKNEPERPKRAKWARAIAALTVMSRASTLIGVWFLSLIATLLLPCLPLIIELVRQGHATPDTIFVTAAVLSASFLFSAEHYLYLCLYILLFGGNLILDLARSPSAPFSYDAFALPLLGAVLFAHAIERFWWHVVQDRPFPDRWIGSKK